MLLHSHEAECCFYACVCDSIIDPVSHDNFCLYQKRGAYILNMIWIIGVKFLSNVLPVFVIRVAGDGC